jgi:hypothetical protein
MDKTTKDLLGLNFDSAGHEKWKSIEKTVVTRQEKHSDGYKQFRRDMLTWFNSFNCSTPIDIGCGANKFKGKIPNVIGLDMFNDNADILASIESNPFESNSIDGAIIFGSIQFLSEEYTLSNFDIAMSWIQPNSPILFKCRSKSNLEFERNIKNDKYTNRAKVIRDRNIEWTDEMLEHVIEKHNLEVVRSFENMKHRHFLFIKR